MGQCLIPLCWFVRCVRYITVFCIIQGEAVFKRSVGCGAVLEKNGQGWYGDGGLPQGLEKKGWWWNDG